MKFTGSVKKGKLELHDKSSFNEFISQSEGDVWVIIKPMPKTRSPQQNNYYWIIIKSVANEIGYTHDELHEIVKVKFEILNLSILYPCLLVFPCLYNPPFF